MPQNIVLDLNEHLNINVDFYNFESMPEHEKYKKGEFIFKHDETQTLHRVTVRNTVTFLRNLHEMDKAMTVCKNKKPGYENFKAWACVLRSAIVEEESMVELHAQPPVSNVTLSI